MSRSIILTLVALAFAGCGRGSAPVGRESASPQAAVDIATARAGWVPVTRQLRVTGTLPADEEAEVAAETAGRVLETPVERGSRVDEGPPLVKLAPAEAQAALQEAEANVAQIEVRLGVDGEQVFDVE